jgi:hypothetical protein
MTLQDTPRNNPQTRSPQVPAQPPTRYDGRVPQRDTPGRPVQGNGLAVASLVLGITSIAFCWWGLLTLVQIVLAVVFGGVAIQAANQGAGRKGMAVAGLLCGVVGFAAYVLFGISTLGIGFIVQPGPGMALIA